MWCRIFGVFWWLSLVGSGGWLRCVVWWGVFLLGVYDWYFVSGVVWCVGCVLGYGCDCVVRLC